MAPFAITVLLALIAVLLVVVISLLIRMRTILIAIHDSLGSTDRIEEKTDVLTPEVHGRVSVIVGGIVIVGSIVGLLLLATIAGLVLTMKTKDGVLVIEVNEPNSQVQLLNGESQIEISRKVEKGPLTMAIKSGRHQLRIQKNGFEFYTVDFDIKAGEKTSIIAKLVPVIVENGTQNVDQDGNTVETVAFQQWMKDVAAMPAEKQIEAVSRKLVELNPGFDGKVTHKTENGSVTELQIVTDNVTDISPVQALMGMKVFICRGSDAIKGKLSDLSPLKGMSLTSLDCGSTNVADLSPLRGMPLTQFCFSSTPVSDLSPLQGMQLTWLKFNHTKVADLSPLRGMPLTTLEFANTGVSDLAVLKELPLTLLSFDFKPERDVQLLRSIKTLETINSKPVVEFWKEVEDKKSP